MNTATTRPMPDVADVRQWPSIADLAATSGIAGRTLRRAIADGDLPAFRLNCLRVNPQDFNAWLAQRQK